MLQYLRTWLRSIAGEKGQDLAEYALLIALIAIVVVVAVAFLGGQIGAAFNRIAEEINFTP
jgi:pilus assembly protein Flp/PilA